MVLKGTFISVRRGPGVKDPGSFRLRREGDGQTVICMGFGWNLKKGTPLYVTGKWINEDTCIFEAQDIRFLYEDQDKCVRFFQKGHFRGVGEKNAVKLYKVLKEKAENLQTTFDCLSENQIYEVMDQLRLTDSKVQISAAILGIHIRYQIADSMSTYKVTPRDVESLYASYGESALDEIKKSPYDGMAFGISFRVCDRIAWSIEHKDPWNSDRIKAVLKQLANKIGSEGSCCIRIKQAVDYIFYLLNDSPYEEMPKSMIYTELISSKQFVIQNTESYGIVIYPKYYYYVERDIVTEIRRLNNSKEELGFSEYRGESNLDEDQIKAVDFLKSSGLKILYGGPGAGKTTTIHEFIEEFKLLRPNQSIILCAPTGRAAARITESCGGNYNALTIHKLLGVAPYEAFMKCQKDCDNPLPKGLFILDEMSMTDELLFLRFLQAIPNGSLVILSGDPDQLPSVQSGTVLRDLIDSKMLESVRLNGNHRQNGGSIVENYKKLLVKDVHLICDESFEILKIDNLEDTIKKIHEIYSKNYTDKPDEFQILTALKKGDLGRDRINQMVSEWRSNISEDSGPVSYGYKEVNGTSIRVITRKGLYSIGDRIIMTKNNYSKGYWNGDVGVIDSIEYTGEYKVKFYDGIRTIDQEGANDMEHAFAITVHKSQGSEYGHVLLILDPQYPNMLYRSLFLTAITRAKNKVTIITSKDAVYQSIRTDRDALRITGLREMMGKNI